MLPVLAQAPDLFFKQALQASEALYKNNSEQSEEQSLATQMLLNLAQRADISVEQSIQIAKALYESNSEQSEEQSLATQMLFQLTQRLDLLPKQRVQVTLAFYQNSPSSQEEHQQAFHILLSLVQSSDLTFEQILQIIQRLYQSSKPKSGKRRQVIQILWEVAQKQSFKVEQRLQIATLPLIIQRADYMDRAQAVRTVLTLVQAGKARQYLENHWRSNYDYPYSYWSILDEIHSSIQRTGRVRRVKHSFRQFSRSNRSLKRALRRLLSKDGGTYPFLLQRIAEPIDIPYILELAQQELLPTIARDEMYQILRPLIPQFDEIYEPDE